MLSKPSLRQSLNQSKLSQHCMYLLSRFLSLFCSFGACCSKVVLALIGPVLSFLAVSLIATCTYVYFTVNIYFLTDPKYFNLSNTQSNLVTLFGIYLLVKTLFHYFATMLIDPGTPPPSHSWTHERRMLLALDPEINGSHNVLTGDQAIHREMHLAKQSKNQSSKKQSNNQSTSQSAKESEQSNDVSETTVLIDHSHDQLDKHISSTNESNTSTSDEQSTDQNGHSSDQSINQPTNQSLDLPYRYCYECERIKPSRTHHCSICNRCVQKMDHHCPWVNNCVGYRNFKHFVLFTFYLFFVCAFSLYTGKPNVMRVFVGRTTSLPVMITSVIALSGMIASLIFIGWNSFLFTRNQTTIEFYGSFLRRPGTDPSINQSNNHSRPYDLGLKHNFMQVFGPDVLKTIFLPLNTRMMGDGCVFPMSQGRGWPLPQLMGEKSDV